MILCSPECVPCCDFCVYAIQEVWIDEKGRGNYGGPDGCSLHKDQRHQKIVEDCGYCSDFHCFRAKEKAPDF